MKDQEGPTAKPRRTVRCQSCGYDVPALLDDPGEEKVRVRARDVWGAGSLGDAVGSLAAMFMQDLPALHTAPCGLQCLPGDAEGMHPLSSHGGAPCASCAHLPGCEECRALAEEVTDIDATMRDGR